VVKILKYYFKTNIPHNALTLCISNDIVLHMTEKANTTPSWGRMLTKKELLDLLARIEAKGKARKDKEK
jgi:hypothetical protein